MSQNQQQQRLIGLLVKKITGTSQTDEEDELLRHMEEDPTAKQFAKQFNPEFLAKELALKEEIDTAAEWEKFREQAGFRTKVIRWRSGWVMAVAASLLLIITTGLYLALYRNDLHNTTVLNHPTVKDIPRPEGKAILTMADGKSVVLGSENAGNEELKGQGILNLNDTALYYGKNSGSTVSWNTVATPRGVSYKLVLPDGTGVWLNTASSIRFPTSFTGTKREVTVTGETYFEVAKDKSKPFIVQANDVAVQVLGTSFNIEAWPEKAIVSTTLLEGSVLLESVKGKLTLKPGQQAVAGQTIKVNNDTDIDQVMAWKKEQFVFRANTIEDIMENLVRYYDFEVAYQAPITSSLFVGTFSRNAPLSEILLFLEKTGSVHFRVEGRKVTVMP
jgi:transmembrane sensor